MASEAMPTLPGAAVPSAKQLADRKRSFLMSSAAAAMRLSWQRARGTDR
jgi:hypothetical protein